MKKNRKEREDRQRDSGKEGRPAAPRVKGGGGRMGRRRAGREECTTGQLTPVSAYL